MLDHVRCLQLNLGSDCKKNVHLVRVLAISFFGLVSTVLTNPNLATGPTLATGPNLAADPNVETDPNLEAGPNLELAIMG